VVGPVRILVAPGRQAAISDMHRCLVALSGTRRRHLLTEHQTTATHKRSLLPSSALALRQCSLLRVMESYSSVPQRRATEPDGGPRWLPRGRGTPSCSTQQHTRQRTLVWGLDAVCCNGNGPRTPSTDHMAANPTDSASLGKSHRACGRSALYPRSNARLQQDDPSSAARKMRLPPGKRTIGRDERVASGF